jgi:hypothetical protein
MPLAITAGASKIALPARLERSITQAIHAVSQGTGAQPHLNAALQRAIARDPQNKIGLRTAVFNANIQATSLRSTPMDAKVALHHLVDVLGDRFDTANLKSVLHGYVPQH